MSRKFLDYDGLLYFWNKVKTLLSGKVDKVDGKGLSTNDYTTDEKNKLAGIEAGANKTTIYDGLDSTSTTYGLSAAKGKQLNELLSDVQNNKMDISVYDEDEDGIVDLAANSSQLEGHGASYFAKATDIPKVTTDLTNALKANYDAAYTHSQAAHAPVDAEKNVIITVKKNGTALTPDSNRAVDVTVPTKVSELTNDKGYLTEHQDISGKADKATTLSGYGITDAYTKAQTNSAIATAKQEAIEAVLDGVTEDYDTLKEVAAWIASDTTNSAALIARVDAIENDYVKDSELTAITNAEIDTILAS